jgi:Rha family phage regulatory protein
MNDLVVLQNDIPMVSSQLVAEKFGKVHTKLMRDIDALHCSDDFKVANYGHCSFTNKMNRSFAGYMMTKDGFAFLCMGFTGKKAGEWKEKYITAFNAMEQALLNKSNGIEWKQARLQSIGARKSVTDQISEFVKYATKQGSKSATMYYSNITKMEYKALELISKNEKVPKDFRDTLDAMDLSFLTTAEYIARKALQDGMNESLHYKEVFIHAKVAVSNFAETVTVLRIN